MDKIDRKNIVRLHDHFFNENNLCLVTELLHDSLYECIKLSGFKGFTKGFYG